MNNQKMRDHVEIIRTINVLFTTVFCLTLWAGVRLFCDYVHAGGLFTTIMMIVSYASIILIHNMIAGYADMLEATLLSHETNAKILDCLQNKNSETKQETQSENVGE